MNFAKFLRTPFSTEHLWWLLLFLEERDIKKMKEMLNVISDAVLRIFYLQSHCPRVFCKKGVPTNFAKFAEKQPYRTLFKKKLFEEILQNLQEKTCPGVSFLLKLQAPSLQLQLY